MHNGLLFVCLAMIFFNIQIDRFEWASILINLESIPLRNLRFVSKRRSRMKKPSSICLCIWMLPRPDCSVCSKNEVIMEHNYLIVSFFCLSFVVINSFLQILFKHCKLSYMATLFRVVRTDPLWVGPDDPSGSGLCTYCQNVPLALVGRA